MEKLHDKDINFVNIKNEKDQIMFSVLNTEIDNYDELVIMIKEKGDILRETNLTASEKVEIAIRTSNLELLNSLEAEGTDIENIVLDNGFTIFHMAVLLKNMNIIKELLVRGFDINILSDNGMTPLECAILINMPEMVEYLKSHGAKKDLMSFEEVIDGTLYLSEKEKEIIKSFSYSTEIVGDILENIPGFINSCEIIAENVSPKKEQNRVDEIFDELINGYIEDLEFIQKELDDLTIPEFENAFSNYAKGDKEVVLKMENRLLKIKHIIFNLKDILNNILLYNKVSHKYNVNTINKLRYSYNNVVSKYNNM